MFITCVNDTGDKLFTGVNNTGDNFSPVSTTPVNNPCHGFSVIAGVVDTGDKFLTGDNDTGDKFIAGDKNKDAMEVGSYQGYGKVEEDKSPAAEVGHGRRWCHWNRHEKLHP
jgi:hypothetical protein